MDSFYSNGISILTIFDEMYAMGSSRGREDSGYTYTYIYICVFVCVSVCVYVCRCLYLCVYHIYILYLFYIFFSTVGIQVQSCPLPVNTLRLVRICRPISDSILVIYTQYILHKKYCKLDE